MEAIGHLNLSIVTHCNNRCVSCSASAPWAELWFAEPKDLRNDLEKIKTLLQIHQIWIIGGEPLLHPKVVEILKLVKEIRASTDYILMTNGRLLPQMPTDFWENLHYLSISVYPNLDPAVIVLATVKSKLYGFGLGTNRFDTFYKQFQTSEPEGKFKNCHWKSDCYGIYKGHFYLCPQAIFFPYRFMGLEEHTDGLPLAGATPESVSAYMHRTEPFKACSICGAIGPQAPWCEAESREDWLEKSKL